MKKHLKLLLAVLSFSFLTGGLSAAKFDESLLQGYEAYRKNDWASAMFFFRKTGASKEGFTDESLYMLVMSEMFAGEYESAFSDSNLFLNKFASSQYAPYIQYQKGRSLHYLGKNEDSVLVLSDFCHHNPENELYASALYWIAECFYAEYNFESARGLYERIVSDFPDDVKVTDSRYRIEMIEMRAREEKLLYLLKMTGEENLAAKEDYERQIRLYQTEDKLGLRKQLSDARSQIESLEEQLKIEKAKVADSADASVEGDDSIAVTQVSDSFAGNSDDSELTTVVNSYDFDKSSGTYDAELEALKRKARQLQYYLDEQRRWTE